MSIQKLDGSNFKDTINKADNIVVVDFYADWCMPCKMIAPILEEMSKEKSDVGFYKLNIDENPELAAEYSIMSIPYVISFKNGDVYKKVIGAYPKNVLMDLVE